MNTFCFQKVEFDQEFDNYKTHDISAYTQNETVHEYHYFENDEYTVFRFIYYDDNSPWWR